MVIGRSGHSLQGFDPGKFKNHPLHIAFEFEQAGPFLEREGGLPHIPEVCFKEVWSLFKPFPDRHNIQIFFRRQHQFSQRQTVIIVESHAGHVLDDTFLINEAGLGMSWMQMIKIQDFLSHTHIGFFQGRDRGKEFPEVLIGLLVEHPASPAHKTLAGITCAVVAAAQDFHSFKYGNLISGIVAVPNQISSPSHAGQSAADEPGMLSVVVTELHFRSGFLVFHVLFFFPGFYRHCCCSCHRACGQNYFF